RPPATPLARPAAPRPRASAAAARSASPARPPRRRLAVGLLRLLALGIEDRLHPLLLAALHHAPVLGQVDRDPFAGHHVVVAPDARVADEQHALLGVVVLRALRGAHSAIPRDDPHVAGRYRPHDALAPGIEIHFHAIRVLRRTALARHDVPGEDDQAFLLEVFQLIGIHRHRRVAVVPARPRQGIRPP